MKYCINFYGENIDLLDKADEINIDISKLKDIMQIAEFCELHKNQRINLCINDFEDAINKHYLYEIFDIQKQLSSFNIVIRLPYYHTGYLEEINKKYPNRKIFFDKHINNWDELWLYLTYNITDMYITDGLGFELDKVSLILHNYSIAIRVFPNVAQALTTETAAIKKFWIRPEDSEVYEKYVDTYEFFGEPKNQKVYYDIYAIDKQ